jgi:hypothetical protein
LLDELFNLLQQLLEFLGRKTKLLHQLLVRLIERLANTKEKEIKQFFESPQINGAFYERRSEGGAKQ